MKALFLALIGFASSACLAAPQFVYSPYKDLAIARDGTTNTITFSHDGRARPAIVGGKPAFGAAVLSWAFATGECGDEQWTGVPGQDVADANVAAFDRAGAGYIVSTGGQAGIFTCASDAGMERFIRRYASPHLIGFDFDIEAGQSAEQVKSLIARVASAQQRHPHLRFSFTVPTFAAADASLASLTEQGELILQLVRASGLRNAAINLMVMDFGPAEPASCVVRSGACDMGASALQAARNLHAKYGVPMNQIELTAMIGVNDVAENVFTLDDARTLAQAARTLGLAGVHFWSLDRDTPCSASGALATCSSMPGLRSGDYTRTMAGERP